MHRCFLQTTFPSDHNSKPRAKSFLALFCVRITISKIVWLKIDRGMRSMVNRSSRTLALGVLDYPHSQLFWSAKSPDCRIYCHVSCLDQWLGFPSQLWASGLPKRLSRDLPELKILEVLSFLNMVSLLARGRPRVQSMTLS
jgi:hypothetical protein